MRFPDDDLEPRMVDRAVSALRWLTVIVFAGVITVWLISVMATLIDEHWIAAKLTRYYKLEHAEPCEGEECEEAGPSKELEWVEIEGSVGMLRGGNFLTVPDAEVIAERADGTLSPVELDRDGGFRYIESWPSQATRAREGDYGLSQQMKLPHLILRSPDCKERRVPVPRAWIERRILLDCDE